MTATPTTYEILPPPPPMPPTCEDWSNPAAWDAWRTQTARWRTVAQMWGRH